MTDPEPTRADSDNPGALPVGTRLGEYELRSVIGVGGFGIVYLAFDHALEREVAIKEYMPATLATRSQSVKVAPLSLSVTADFETGLSSFVNEGRLLARFDSPSLLKVYRYWEANGTAYITMPRYRGRTLKEHRAAMATPPDETAARALLMPLLSALELLHRESVYHRDVAPDNILIEADNRPVLLDFGAARRVIGEKSQALTAILKPAYAPIEQYGEAASVKQGAWTDLYALGATMHFYLLGQAPPPSTARAVQDEMQPLAGRDLPGCSEAFPEDHRLDAGTAPGRSAAERGRAGRCAGRPRRAACAAGGWGRARARARTRASRSGAAYPGAAAVSETASGRRRYSDRHSISERGGTGRCSAAVGRGPTVVAARRRGVGFAGCSGAVVLAGQACAGCATATAGTTGCAGAGPAPCAAAGSAAAAAAPGAISGAISGAAGRTRCRRARQCERSGAAAKARRSAASASACGQRAAPQSGEPGAQRGGVAAGTGGHTGRPGQAGGAATGQSVHATGHPDAGSGCRRRQGSAGNLRPTRLHRAAQLHEPRVRQTPEPAPAGMRAVPPAGLTDRVCPEPPRRCGTAGRRCFRVYRLATFSSRSQRP